MSEKAFDILDSCLLLDAYIRSALHVLYAQPFTYIRVALCVLYAQPFAYYTLSPLRIFARPFAYYTRSPLRIFAQPLAYYGSWERLLSSAQTTAENKLYKHRRKTCITKKKKKRSTRIKKENLLLQQLTRAREKWREGSGERAVGLGERAGETRDEIAGHWDC